MNEKIKKIGNTLLTYFFEHPLRTLVIWYLIIGVCSILSFAFNIPIPSFIESFFTKFSVGLTIIAIATIIYPFYLEEKKKKQ